MSLVVSDVVQAVNGLASCCNNTHADKSMIFSSDGWSQTNPKEVVIQGTGDCGPLGHVVRRRWALIFPQLCHYHFSHRCRHVEFLCVLVSWNGTILSSPSSFQAASSGPSFYLKSLCVSGGCQLLFCITAKFSGRCSYFLPAVQASVVNTLWSCSTSWMMW
jgi:hypothetical protein